MRTTTPTQSIEKLLRTLFEGTASDGPWIEHNIAKNRKPGQPPLSWRKS